MDYLKQLERVHTLQTIVDKFDIIQTTMIEQTQIILPKSGQRDSFIKLMKMVCEKCYYEGVTLDDDVNNIDPAIIGAIVMGEVYDTSVNENLKYIIEQIKSSIKNSK
jgi:hypothetical protein